MLGFFCSGFVLVLIWDIVELIEVSFNTGNRWGETLGPTSNKNRKATAMTFSGIQYCLFIYTLVNKLHFVKILGYLFN